MFRDVPGCSGMFRNVPGCSMFRVLSTPPKKTVQGSRYSSFTQLKFEYWFLIVVSQPRPQGLLIFQHGVILENGKFALATKSTVIPGNNKEKKSLKQLSTGINNVNKQVKALTDVHISTILFNFRIGMEITLFSQEKTFSLDFLHLCGYY